MCMYLNTLIIDMLAGPPSHIPSQNLRDILNIYKERQNKNISVTVEVS